MAPEARHYPFSGYWSDEELRGYWTKFERLSPGSFALWIELYAVLRPKIMGKRPDQYDEAYRIRSSGIQTFIRVEVLPGSESERPRRRALYDDMLLYFAKTLNDPDYLRSKLLEYNELLNQLKSLRNEPPHRS